MNKIIPIILILLCTTIKGNTQTVTDIDGNVYGTTVIGTQVWTTSNLKVTRYRNGDSIPNITDSLVWLSLTSGAYCNYQNDTAIAAVYGKLYNWYAVSDIRNLAPVGWHVATFEDWDTLQVFLGYDLVAGGKLKEMGTAHWMSPNTGASDEYDFTALPGGQRTDAFYGGAFTELTQQGYWWSSSEMDTVYPWGMNISYDSEGFTNWAASTRKAGFAVRLMQDAAVGLNSIYKQGSINVYPNPASERIFITSMNRGTMKVAIYNLNGICLIHRELTGLRNEIDISNLPAGLYLFKVTGDGWSEMRKVVLE